LCARQRAPTCIAIENRCIFVRVNRIIRSVLIAAALSAAAASLFPQSSGGGRGGGQGAGGTAGGGQRSDAGRAAPVATAEVSVQYHSISVGGRLQPRTRVVHQAPSAGYVISVNVSEGDRVEPGSLLLSIGRKDDVANLYKPLAVTARVEGWVSEVLVQAQDEVGQGDAAVVILGREGYVLEASVSDKDAFKVDVGQPVAARTSGGSRITGVLHYRSQEPDYQTGLFSLTFYFPNSQRTHVGEFVMVELPVDRTRGLFVRRDLVVRRYGRYFLWIVDDNQELEAREVELGETFGELVEIRTGLEEGERYLTRLTGREREGARIGSPGS